jgi:hypothetical protein
MTLPARAFNRHHQLPVAGVVGVHAQYLAEEALSIAPAPILLHQVEEPIAVGSLYSLVPHRLVRAGWMEVGPVGVRAVAHAVVALRLVPALTHHHQQVAQPVVVQMLSHVPHNPVRPQKLIRLLLPSPLLIPVAVPFRPKSLIALAHVVLDTSVPQAWLASLKYPHVTHAQIPCVSQVTRRRALQAEVELLHRRVYLARFRP